jgi:hypothetical protein
MRRTLLALSASLATLALAGTAAADESTEHAPTAKSIEENNQGLLTKGAVIFGAERVFGLSVTSFKPENVDATKITQYGVLWSKPNSVFTTPRLAFDYVAFDQVTFGGSAAFAHEDVGDGRTSWIVAPRAGYIFGGRGVLSLWMRAGFSVWSMPTFTNDSTWGFALNVEPEILLSPYRHVGIYIGGVLDAGLFGHYKSLPNANGVTTEGGYTVTNYGATGGLRAWF